MLIVRAPAKLNLTLEVLSKRPDDFHEIRSVMQTINLCDSLRFQHSRDDVFRSDMPDWAPQKSLITRAVGLLRERTGCSKGVTIDVSKNIPLVSGLGGDSSDAAATLHGLNHLWGLDLPPEELLGLAVKLGSDVAFFRYGGTALAEGRGEVITPLPPLPYRWVILVVPRVPEIPGKTAWLYASLKDSNFTDGRITNSLVEVLKADKEFTSSLLFNTFENVAFTRFAELSVYREHMIKIGADHVHLAGSGPALFTLVKERSRAEKLCLLFQQQGMVPYMTDTLTTIDKQ